ncbi:hypothetical protein P8452_00876 [Trifolium repens]|nr:hypothetical protein P8452_00876 [Trifolium repens]
MITCPIYASNSDDSVLGLDLASYTKMFEVNTTIDANRLWNNLLILSWPFPKTKCAVCAAKGKKCRWNNSSPTKGDIECYDCHHKRKTFHIPKSIIFSDTRSIILGLVIIAITMFCLHFKEKIKEDQVRIDKFLEDYKAQKPARFSYADVKRITDRRV